MTTNEGFRRARLAWSGRGVTATLAGMLAILGALVVVGALLLGLFEAGERRAPRRGRLAAGMASHPTCRARIQALRRLGG
jgi:hypothetical protein